MVCVRMRSVRGRVTPVCIHIYIYSYVKYIIYIQNKKLSLYLSLLYIYIYIYMAWVSPAECICVFFHLFRWPAGNAQQRSVLKSLIFYIFAKIPPKTDLFKEYTSEGNEDVVLVP